MTICMLGKTRAGKSKLLGAILGNYNQFPVGYCYESFTRNISSKQDVVYNRNVKLIDVPGL